MVVNSLHLSHIVFMMQYHIMCPFYACLVWRDQYVSMCSLSACSVNLQNSSIKFMVTCFPFLVTGTDMMEASRLSQPISLSRAINLSLNIKMLCSVPPNFISIEIDPFLYKAAPFLGHS